MVKNWTCWKIKQFFPFSYNSKIWPKDLRKVANFIVPKILKLYNENILPKDLSSPMVIKLWTFFEFKFSMWYVFKNKTGPPTHLNRIGCICTCFQEIRLNWLCFGFVSSVLILDIFFSQDVWLYTMWPPKLFAWKYTVTSAIRIYS